MRGISKAVDRASTSLMQKAGFAEKTVDRDFEDEEKRYRTLETKVSRLGKEAKGYLDSVRSLTIAAQRIADTINQFYDDSARLSTTAMCFKNSANELDESVRTALDRDFRATVLDPLQQLNEIFPTVNETIRRRQKKLLDYDSSRSKVRSLAEKPSDDPEKLPRAEQKAAEVKEMYESINFQLIEDLPKIVDQRVPYLDATFEALIKCQLKFAEEAYRKLEHIRLQTADCKDMQLSAEVESALQHMRDLSIVNIGNGGGVTSPSN